MTSKEKWELWRKYPKVWEMFEEFNGITQEDDEAWRRLIDRVEQLNAIYRLPVVRELLKETVGDLEKISLKRAGKICRGETDG